MGSLIQKLRRNGHHDYAEQIETQEAKVVTNKRSEEPAIIDKNAVAPRVKTENLAEAVAYSGRVSDGGR